MNFIGNNCEAPPPNFIGTSFVCGIDDQAEASWLPLTLPFSPIPFPPSIRLRVLNSPAIEASTTLRAIKSQSNHQQPGNATETITNGNGNAYAHTRTHTHSPETTNDTDRQNDKQINRRNCSSTIDGPKTKRRQ